MSTVIIFLAIHILICAVIMLIKRREKSLVMENVLPLVIAVPVFGALCFAVRLWKARSKKLGSREVGLDDFDIMKGRYEKIEVEENGDMQVVPLEEALLVNNAKVRHSLMLNILHRSPNEYVEMLQKARSSEDMEVTHYATTMMMEILTEYEKNLQDYDHRHNESHDANFLREYIEYLDEFICTKLVSGNIERIYRERLARLIEEYENNRDRIGRLLFVSIENYLILGRSEKAREQLERAQSEYPDDERVFKLYGQYYDSIRDYGSLCKMIDYIKENNIYLSQDGREWLAFWEVGKARD